ncbi:hypothetical protein RRG08_053693 [Elysia crispata]|uniref:Uncharacterized protein n=1 Tax=Elysia crispata TaxID=231223 RepID=A0AAE1B888_9GAST|nr:hypothetical protein RRG08_053693 [Elysia crispata]
MGPLDRMSKPYKRSLLSNLLIPRQLIRQALSCSGSHLRHYTPPSGFFSLSFLFYLHGLALLVFRIKKASDNTRSRSGKPVFVKEGNKESRAKVHLYGKGRKTAPILLYLRVS